MPANRNLLFMIIGAPVVLVGVLSYNLYQDRKQPQGLQINVGPNGLKVQGKESGPPGQTMVSSLSAPRRTILIASSGNGCCNAFASSHGARIHKSRSSSVVRITGMAFEWIGSTTAFGDVVRNP